LGKQKESKGNTGKANKKPDGLEWRYKAHKTIWPNGANIVYLL
jgi:hypothetical protein